MSSSEESDDSTDIFEVERIVDSKRKVTNSNSERLSSSACQALATRSEVECVEWQWHFFSTHNDI